MAEVNGNCDVAEHPDGLELRPEPRPANLGHARLLHQHVGYRSNCSDHRENADPTSAPTSAPAAPNRTPPST